MKKRASIVVAILLLAVGFAAVSTTLIINGSAKVGENTEDFDVIFTKAKLDSVDVYDQVISEDKKTITFETNDLKTLNQTSVLNYIVTNNSSNYDAEVSLTCTPTSGEYTSIKNELDAKDNIVEAKNIAKGKLTIKLNKTVTEETTEKYTCTLSFIAVERDTVGQGIPEPVSFSEDSWSTIAGNVKSENTSKYNVGDTKEVDLGDLGTHTVRIANMSECVNGETSETACGFVVEFTDIITKQKFNSTKTNVGGWRDSEMRTYINETIYNALPSELQNVITTTKVISSHGSTSGETNFETEDKLYLLNAQEIWESNRTDTSVGTSKQLDYYKNQGVTVGNYETAIKQYNESNDFWWLRSAHSSYDSYFYVVSYDGDWGMYLAYENFGISPAFRIA